MQRIPSPVFVAVLAVAFAAAPISPASAASIWQVVASPSPGTDIRNDFLVSTAAISTADAWAVGFHTATADARSATLTEHWNGTAWSVVPSPNLSGSDELNGVAAAASNDVWAVGVDQSVTGGTYDPLIEHWNGTAWQVVPGPDVTIQPDDSAQLTAVTVISASNVWATGWFAQGSSILPLFEHWNGSSWQVSPAPAVPSGTYLFPRAISAVSATDIWVVGTDRTGIPGERTVSLHWNGTAWSVVTTPNPFAASFNILWGVKAISANDVWAVGEGGEGGFGDFPLIVHWNGSAWTTVAAANPKQNSRLFGITARSATDVWAVGDNRDADGNGTTLTQRWNGTAWSTVASPNGTGSNLLFGISVVGTRAWAVGVQDAPAGECCTRTLVLRTDQA